MNLRMLEFKADDEFLSTGLPGRSVVLTTDDGCDSISISCDYAHISHHRWKIATK